MMFQAWRIQTNGRWGLAQRFHGAFRPPARPSSSAKILQQRADGQLWHGWLDGSARPRSEPRGRIDRPVVAGPDSFFMGMAASWANMFGRAAGWVPRRIPCPVIVTRSRTSRRTTRCHGSALAGQGQRRPIKIVASPPPPPPPPPRHRRLRNRPPTVTASCNPCTVEVGRTATVTADAQDPDGDPLTYQWTAPAGTITSPTNRQTPWTAPNVEGPVVFTVVVNDGRGGTARANTTIQVVRPPQAEIAFEDVHFEFDRFTLREDALRVLDEAVKAMQANPNLRLQIEGHTCNIGTAEYNLALGERRAQAVRDYLTSRGIAAARLSTVTFGEERPKFDNAREETRRLNRRAALVVRLQ